VTPLEEPRFEGSVRLRDDRRLGFAEYGPVTGRPLLWFHGTPGARRQIAPEARTLAHEHGVRIVCVERPGIGESTPHAYAALIDFADDIKQLCAALEIDRFAVAGLSGGGPDAARGGANELIRAFSPLLERSWRPLGGVMQRLVRALERWADPATDLFARFMPPGDQAVFAEPATRRMFQEDMFIGSREQMHAIWLDARLFGREWGFDLRDVRVPAFLRYGDADIIVPLAHGEHLAKRLPDAELRVYSGEGHLGSLGASREIFEFVLERWE
jgi:pimeloyl-ACP methyl ester carboxylesterase